jgi:hypothetical protein
VIFASFHPCPERRPELVSGFISEKEKKDKKIAFLLILALS